MNNRNTLVAGDPPTTVVFGLEVVVADDNEINMTKKFKNVVYNESAMLFTTVCTVLQ